MSVAPLKFDPAAKFTLGPAGVVNDDPTVKSQAPAPHDFPAWRELRKSSQVMIGMFVEIAKSAWNENGNFIETFPPTIRYSDDLSKSHIDIDAEYNFTELKKDPSCIIGVKLGAIQFTTTPGANRDGQIGHSQAMNHRYYSRTGKGTVTYSHVGTSDGQSIALGDSTQEFIEAYAGVLRAHFGFNQLAVVARTPITEQPRKMYGRERYSSDVVVGFEFENTWELVEECPKLQEIFFSPGQRPYGRCTITNDPLSP